MWEVGQNQKRSLRKPGRLEYRGYDSSGICFVENGRSRVVRSEGKLKIFSPS